ncbi:unnamed protein product [Aphanomyces euteiches]
MNKKFYQATSLLLVLMIMVVFSGCSKSATTTDSSSAASTAPGATAAAVTDKPLGVTELQMFSTTTTKVGLQKGWWPDLLKEKAGVTLNLIPAGDQADQKLQALMAGGELPDLVVFHTRQQVEDAVKADMLINLDEHLDKLPNLVKYASTAMQYYRDTASNGTGKLYAATTFVGPVEEGLEPNWGPYLRWDLYKKLGMPEVNELEDYLPLVKKMQDMEPKNKDGQKTYGFSLWKDWDSFGMANAMGISVLNGIDTGNQLSGLPFLQVNMVTGDTKSILAPDSEYLRVLKFYYKANQMGLMDPDSLTQRFETVREKYKTGRLLFALQSWLGGDFNNFDVENRVNANPPIGFKPVMLKNAKVFKFADQKLGGDPWAFGIGKSTKNLDAALRLIDYMYTPEANSYIYNGPKGVIWDMDANGIPAITEKGWDIIDNQKDLPGGGKLSDAFDTIGVQGLTGTVIDPTTNAPVGHAFWDSFRSHNPKVIDTDWQKTTGFKNTMDMIKGKKLYVETTTAMKLIPTLNDEMTALKSSIGDVVKNDSWLAVFAKNDAEFQKYVDDMAKKADTLGIQKLLDIDLANWKKANDDAAKYDK